MTNSMINNIEFEEVPLPGEPPTDKAFATATATYRVRLIIVDSARPDLVSTSGIAAPIVQRADISLTKLGEDGLPMRLTNGQVIIVAQTGWTIDHSQIAAGVDLSAELMRVIGSLIAQAEASGTTQDQVDAIRADWGGAAPVIPIAVENINEHVLPEVIDEAIEERFLDA